MRYAPVLERSEDALNLSRLQVTAHGVFNLELLFLLVELAANDILVDGVDNKILKLSDSLYLEDVEKVRVRKNLDTSEATQVKRKAVLERDIHDDP